MDNEETKSVAIGEADTTAWSLMNRQLNGRIQLGEDSKYFHQKILPLPKYQSN